MKTIACLTIAFAVSLSFSNAFANTYTLVPSDPAATFLPVAGAGTGMIPYRRRMAL